MPSLNPFRYPTEKHVRRHGPRGYANYRQYREWLRDEFQFRCVFCLQREQWTQLKGAFDIDHFQPQVLRPELTEDYDNLLYACRACNLDKSSRLVPDPHKVAYGECLAVSGDGSIHALNDDGHILIDELDLDSDSRTRFRAWMLEAVALAAEHKPEMLGKLMGLPFNLPDLSRRKPPGGNSRPDGIENSWFEKDKRGEVGAVLE